MAGFQGRLMYTVLVALNLLSRGLVGTRKAPQGAAKDMSCVGQVLKTSMASSLHLRGYYLLRADDTLGTYLQFKPDDESLLKLWEEAKKEVGVKPQAALLETCTHTTLCPRLSPSI